MKKKLLIIFFGIFLFFLFSNFVNASCPEICHDNPDGPGCILGYPRSYTDGNYCCHDPVCSSGCGTIWLNIDDLQDCCVCMDGPFPWHPKCGVRHWQCTGTGQWTECVRPWCWACGWCDWRPCPNESSENCDDYDGSYCAADIDEYAIEQKDYFCVYSEDIEAGGCDYSTSSDFSCVVRNECVGDELELHRCYQFGPQDAACKTGGFVEDDYLDCSLAYDGSYDEPYFNNPGMCNCTCGGYDVTEVGSALCSDGLDNDCDGKTDIYDTGCSDPPTADFHGNATSCAPINECSDLENCYISYVGPQSTCVFVLENDSSDPDLPPTSTDELRFEWDILDFGVGTEDPLGSWTQAPAEHRFIPANFITSEEAGTYNVELYVEDLAGQSDAITASIEIREDAQAGFECSLGSINWGTVCEELEIFRRRTVYFRDNLPEPYEYSSFSEGATEISTTTWYVDGVIFNSGNNSLASTTLASSSQDIKLTIVDNKDRTASKIHTVPIRFIAPRWTEVSPSF